MTNRTLDGYTVGEVARLAGITVRTLHHYDEIGLLGPRARSDSGYRLYDDTDLERLQQVLVYRELGLPLDDIKAAMGDPGFDRVTALHKQRAQLAGQARRLNRMIAAVEAAIRAEETGMRLTKEEMFEVFGDFDPTQYDDEVKERWGDSDAYRESARRTTAYTKEDWMAIKAEGEAINRRFVDAMAAGIDPSSDQAADIAEAARLQIDQRFYPCSPEMHANLGEMYVADPRFAKTYDDMAPGMAEYVRTAIATNAARSA
ncbi:MAG: MerR family transcriptional regulator [Actinomycetota bacterium]|nr:MerR family transcriptional regulator [Actinomycetota bacterium]